MAFFSAITAMNFLLHWWTRISLTGVTEPAHFLAHRRIILCNQLCLLTVIDTLLYEIFFICFGIHSLIFFHAFAVALYFLVFWLNKKGDYQWAKVLFLTTASVEVLIISAALGKAAGIFLYYFPIVCAAFVLFDYRERKKSLLVIATALVCITMLHLPRLAILPALPVSGSIQVLLFNVTLGTSLLLTILCVYHMVRSNFMAEEQLKEVVCKEETLNKELLASEEELVAHLDNMSLLAGQIESEKAKLSAIVESTDHLIWSVDKDYRLIYCNSNYTRLFKKQFSEDIEAGAAILNLVPTATALYWKALYDKALLGQKFSEEVKGRNWVFEVFLTPIVEGGDIVGITMFMQNISARKKAEREIMAAKEVAEKASLAKAQFLSTMSHEIRTPMNAVVGIAYLLSQQNPRADQLELLHTLRFSSENLLSLINNILDLHKIEAGKVSFEEVDFSPVDLVTNIIQSHQFKANEKGIWLRSILTEGLPATVKGDPARLTQVLNNLIGNAIKFTDSGGVSVAITAEAQTPSQCTLLFCITDTGIGIPIEKQQVIFDAFVQADTDTTRKYGGTGLGLAITKRLLELQESSLELDSQPGVGSRFYFRLTLTKGALPQKSEHQQNPFLPGDLSAVRLLLVDDNHINVMVASKFLQQWNIRPDHAADGLTALHQVQEATYDLVLMDLQMPVMDGFEATRRIRALGGRYLTIPIIALTADTVADVKERAQAAGMNDFLTKPYSPAGLYRVITRHTRSRAGETPDNAYPSRPEQSPVRRLSKLYELAGGDQQFINTMLVSAKRGLEELCEGVSDALQQRDETKLRAVIHKAKVLLELLNLDELLALLNRSRELLQEESATDVLIAQKIECIGEVCRATLCELEEFLLMHALVQ